VRKGENVAKFWLEPTIRLAESYGMKPHELNRLQEVVQKNAQTIKTAWYRHFGR
jgi:hypothetical protein